MTGEEARAAYLEWAANERGMSPQALEVQSQEVAYLLAHLMMNHGRMPDATAIAAIPAEDLDAFLASRTEENEKEVVTRRRANIVRGFQRFCAKWRAEHRAGVR
jgi:site-specific recombinase XerD